MKSSPDSLVLVLDWCTQHLCRSCGCRQDIGRCLVRERGGRYKHRDMWRWWTKKATKQEQSSSRILHIELGQRSFLRRKIGHAHENSADSENVVGAREPNVHAHFVFRFEKRSGKSELFLIHDQSTAETSQPQAQPTDDWCAMDRACPWGLQRPLKKLDSARLSRKKRQTSWIQESFC